MFGSSYRKRLSQDLERWSAEGWIVPGGRKAILTDFDSHQAPNRLPAIIGVLGALLLTIGAMTFVSANWDEMSKLARLIILFSAMWAAFGAAIWFQRSSHDYLLEAMLFLGAGMFGVNIMLIAQIYHIDGHYPDALFLWTIGALLVALSLESRASLALAFVLMVLWAATEMLQFDVVFHWPFLPVWAVGTALLYRLNWRQGMHLAALSLAFWLGVSMLHLGDVMHWPSYQTLGAMALIALAMFVWALSRREGRSAWLMGFEPSLMRYAMLALLSAACFMQLDISNLMQIDIREVEPPDMQLLGFMGLVLVLVLAGGIAAFRNNNLNLTDLAALGGFGVWMIAFGYVAASGLILWFHAPIYLLFSIWLIAYSQHWLYRTLLTMALTAFGVEVLYIYAQTLGTLLDTSLFFFSGGLLLIGLAIGLEKLRRALGGKPAGPQEEASS